MATNMDRLFREKLDQLELPPSAKAWEEVESRIGKKTSAWQSLARVAAVIALLITATWIVYNRPQAGNQAVLANADYPKPMAAPQWTVELPEPAKVATDEPQQPAKKQEAQQPENRIEMDQKPPMISQLSIASIPTKPLKVNLTTEQVRNPIPLKTEAPAIKITYIASTTEKAEEQTDENRINRVLALAREVNPGDLLADLRDAKNNLLNGN